MSWRSSFQRNTEHTYEDFCQNKVCRLCWSNTSSIISIENEPTISEQILECIGIDVTETNIPKTVCLNCLTEIKTFIEYKRFCQENDKKLKTIFSNSLQYQKLDTVDFPVNVKEKNPELAVDKEKTHEQSIIELDEEIEIITKDGDNTNLDFTKQDKNLVEMQEARGESLKETFTSSTDKPNPERQPCDVNTLICNICHKSLPTSEELESHMRVHNEQLLKFHSDDKHKPKLNCKRCGGSFKTEAYLRRHMLIHTNPKQLKCPQCDYRATQSDYLTEHMRIHTGERPYLCDRCPFTSATSSNYNKHRKLHLAGKLYKCEICNENYKNKQQLDDHVLTVHKGLKKYTCKQCGLQYRRFQYLRSHNLIKHGQEIKMTNDDHNSYIELGAVAPKEGAGK